MSFENLDRNGEKKRRASVAQTNSAPSLSSNGCKKVTLEDIEFVQKLIERCLVLYMTKDEATTMLVNCAKIEQGFIHLVWQRLEEENPEFFKAYEIKVLVKKQIIIFNQLLEKQCHLMNSECYAMQQSLNNGHNNMPVTSSMGFPAEQPYLPSRNGGSHMYPFCNGSLNNMMNGVPTVSNFYRTQQNGYQQNGDATRDDQEKMATDFDPHSSAEGVEFQQKQAFPSNICSTEEFHFAVDDSSHLNTTNDWMNFEDCLIADSPCTETQIQTDKDKSLTG